MPGFIHGMWSKVSVRRGSFVAWRTAISFLANFSFSASRFQKWSATVYSSLAIHWYCSSPLSEPLIVSFLYAKKTLPAAKQRVFGHFYTDWCRLIERKPLSNRQLSSRRSTQSIPPSVAPQQSRNLFQSSNSTMSFSWLMSSNSLRILVYIIIVYKWRHWRTEAFLYAS